MPDDPSQLVTLPVRQLGWLSVSAASGLARVGSLLHVVADDELFLDAYDDDAVLRRRVRLRPGRLPDDPVERKRSKYDFEAVCRIPGDRLLVMPSGSTPVRSMAVVIDPASVDAGGDGAAQPVDLSPLHATLRGRFPDLNLEGAAVVGDLLRLLQRGNAARRDNAVVDLALGPTLARIDAGQPLDDGLLVAVRPVDLGSLDGVPLGFTDAAPIEPGGSLIAFVAAAEHTDNAIDDGPCAGSILGLLDEEGHVVWTARLQGDRKFEGLDVDRQRGIRLVDDADDRSQRSGLYAIDWPWDQTPGIRPPR